MPQPEAPECTHRRGGGRLASGQAGSEGAAEILVLRVKAPVPDSLLRTLQLRFGRGSQRKIPIAVAPTDIIRLTIRGKLFDGEFPNHVQNGQARLVIESRAR